MISVSALIVAAGCSLTDLSDLAGGPLDAVVVSDGGSPDTPQLADASDAPFSCAAQSPPHTFCEDFADPDFLNHWTLHTTRGGVLERDPTEYVSPPAALHAALLASPSAAGNCTLLKRFTGTPSEIIIGFDLDVDVQGASSAGFAVVQVTFGNGGQLSALLSTEPTLHINVDELVPLDGGSLFYGNFFPVGTSFAPRKWVHIVLDFGFGGDDAVTATVTVDRGKPLAAAAPRPMAATGGFTAEVGAVHYASPPVDAWSVRVDNFTVDVR